MEHELREDGIQSRRLSWFQTFEGSGNLLRPRGFRYTVALRCWNLPLVEQLLVDEPGGLAVSGPVCPVLQKLGGDGVCRDGHCQKDRPDLAVRLLMVLHAMGLECEKSMELTASSHRPCFCPSRESRDEAALSESVPLGLGWRSDRRSRTVYRSMAHSSSNGRVGCIVWPQQVGSRKNSGMPSQCLMCPAVAISQRIHLWEGKSASNQPCEGSNASPDRCGQGPWASVALWGKADVVASGTFLVHACPAVGCPGRNSRTPGLDWCRRSIGERRSWLLSFGYTTVPGCWMFPRSPGSHRQAMFCCNPSWHVGSWSHQHANCGRAATRGGAIGQLTPEIFPNVCIF